MGGQQSVPIEGESKHCGCLCCRPWAEAVVAPLREEQIFNMQFTARQLNKLSQKHTKDVAKEKRKIRKVRIPRELLCCPSPGPCPSPGAAPRPGDSEGQHGGQADL